MSLCPVHIQSAGSRLPQEVPSWCWFSPHSHTLLGGSLTTFVNSHSSTFNLGYTLQCLLTKTCCKECLLVGHLPSLHSSGSWDLNTIVFCSRQFLADAPACLGPPWLCLSSVYDITVNCCTLMPLLSEAYLHSKSSKNPLPLRSSPSLLTARLDVGQAPWHLFSLSWFGS